MVTAVMLNPGIDRVLTVDKINKGGLNRIVEYKDLPGGKGLNIVKALSSFKVPSKITGFIFEEGGSLINSELAKYNVQADFVSLPGRVRTNIKVLEASVNSVTEFNEPGERVSMNAVEPLIKKLSQLAEKSEYVVFTGSVPPGLPGSIYRSLIVAAKSNGCKTVLDADGKLFRYGMEAIPFMVKPNLFELEQFMGKKLGSLPLIKGAAERIIETGVSYALVSLGSEGAILTDKNVTLYSPGLKIPVKNTVGAGDAMIAGALFAMINGKPASEILKLSSAAATASVSQEGIGLSDISSVLEYSSITEVTEI